MSCLFPPLVLLHITNESESPSISMLPPSIAEQLLIWRHPQVFISTYDLAFSVYEELDEDETMIAPLQLGQLLIDWTDASKFVGLEEDTTDFAPVHVELAIDIMKALYNNERAGRSSIEKVLVARLRDADALHVVEDRKILCQLLGKLVFPADADQQSLNTLYIMVQNLLEVSPDSHQVSYAYKRNPFQLCPFEDPAADKAFSRFKARFERHFSSSLADYDEKACFEDENKVYDEVFAFLGISRPRNRKFEGSLEPDVSARRSRTRELSQAPSEAGSERGPSVPSRVQQNGYLSIRTRQQHEY